MLDALADAVLTANINAIFAYRQVTTASIAVRSSQEVKAKAIKVEAKAKVTKERVTIEMHGRRQPRSVSVNRGRLLSPQPSDRQRPV